MRLHHIAIASALSIAAAGCAHSQTPVRSQADVPMQGQTYSAQDEGRTFADGTRVICDDVEVARECASENETGGAA